MSIKDKVIRLMTFLRSILTATFTWIKLRFSSNPQPEKLSSPRREAVERLGPGPQYYLVPVTSQVIGGQNVNAPKYATTALANTPWQAIPFGAEGVCLLALSADNPALDAEPDVYAFPSTLTKTLAASDVSALSAYFATYNIPSTGLSVVVTFVAVLRKLAQVFLVAQAVLGSTGQGIFAQFGVTPTTTIAAANAVLANSVNTTGKKILPTAAAGAFDFSNVNPATSVGTALVQVSAQFNEPIAVGGATL
jgi:hypothetical protein